MIKKIPLHRRWSLLLKTIPFIIIILILKYLIDFFNYDILQFSALFTAIISANIFLISFLISGVLSDYKESEKIPSDIASSIISLADEGMIMIQSNENTKYAMEYLEHIKNMNQAYLDWFHQKQDTLDIMNQLSVLNMHFKVLNSYIAPPSLARLKQEQNNLRKLLNRADTIRETSFLGTGYAIVETISFILIITMLFIGFNPIYEGIIFTAFVSLILIYMIFFIKDLDNPFGYSKDEILTEEVSLRPLLENKKILKSYLS
ncbi:MAG: hypothetical protein RLZZ223_616 [Candidatus Parcubacteria bacterium]|jgi:hypothetical protein